MRKLIGLGIIGIGFIAILLGIFGYLMAPFSLTWQAYVTMIFLIVVGFLLIAIGIVVYRKGKKK